MKSILKRVLICVCVVVMVSLCFLLPFLEIFQKNEVSAHADSLEDSSLDPSLLSFEPEYIDFNYDMNSVGLYHFSGDTTSDIHGVLGYWFFSKVPVNMYFAISCSTSSGIRVVYFSQRKDGSSITTYNITNSFGILSVPSDIGLCGLRVYSDVSSSESVSFSFSFLCTDVDSLSDDKAYHDGYLAGYGVGYEEGRKNTLETLEPIEYDRGYKVGYAEGYNLKVTESIGGIDLFLKPAQDFINVPLFGNFSIGDAFAVFLFVSLGAIFIKMFAGG